MDAETREGIEKLRNEISRDRRRLNSQSLGLMFLFQADSHPNRQMLWRDLTGYPGGRADWFLQDNWLCGFAVPNANQTNVDYCDVFFDGINQKAIEKFREHACEIASLFEDAGLRTFGSMCREGTLARYLFEFNRDSNSVEWEENEQPGRPETKSRIARLKDVYEHAETLLRSVLETSTPDAPNPISPLAPKTEASETAAGGRCNPEGMPSGELRNLMEKVILTMGERGLTSISNKLVGRRIAAILKPRQNYNSHLKKTLRQLRLAPYELLSPPSGHGYFLNSKGVAVYEQLKKDRLEKSLKKMKSH